MSSALVRQALEFVDPDESCGKRNKRGGRHQSSPGQGSVLAHSKNKKSRNSNLKKKVGNDSEATEEVIKKLLKLSEPTLDKTITEKIVKRAATGQPVAETGQPVAEKIKLKKEEQKSILFPDDDFKQFEKDPFCS